MGGSRFFGSPKFQVTLSSSTHSSWRCDKLTDLGIFTMVFGNMDGISLNLNYKYHYIIIIYSLYTGIKKNIMGYINVESGASGTEPERRTGTETLKIKPNRLSNRKR